MTAARQPLHIAAVQCVSHPGDITGAVGEHVALIGAAADSGAGVVLFPELSLTGYEPDLIDLHGIRIGVDDPILAPLSRTCQQRRVHALVGVPTAGTVLPQIGILHIDARGTVRPAYAKQHLMVGEIGIFGAGPAGAILDIGGWKLALSICSDAAVPAHPAAARRAGADAYLVAGLYIIGSERRLAEQMEQAARQRLWVLLAQYSGGTGGGPACGLSGGWRPGGGEVVRLGAGPGIAIVELTDADAL
jgi:predicted amidohydrolase